MKNDPTVDIQVCKAVRKAVGEAYTVMLDSTWAYQYRPGLGAVIDVDLIEKKTLAVLR